MVRLVTFVCVLAVGSSGVLAMSAKSARKEEFRRSKPQNAEPVDELVVFITGNELGELQPCGCSGGQLGGFDRRAAILNSASPSKRLIVDAGLLVEEADEQGLIKFNVIVQALGMLGYDVVNLAEKDIEIGSNLRLLEGISSVFNVITAQNDTDVNVPARFTRQLALQGQTVNITVAAFDAEYGQIEQISELFPPRRDGQNVNILVLIRCDTAIIDSISSKLPHVDCLICPAETDEPMIISEPNERPLAFSVGRFGRYVGRLQIKPAKSADKLDLSFRPIPVTEDLPQQSSMVQLYKAYQQLVKQANLLQKHPRFTLANGLEYVGSESCKSCHEYEYAKWSGRGHAHAFAAIERVGSQYDPECVICHVVGMDYESGFVSEQETSHMKNVGCENCHGPGSEHIRTFGKAQFTGPVSDCIDCHTPDQSADYAGNEQLYLEKIVHWKEPAAPNDVKE